MSNLLKSIQDLIFPIVSSEGLDLVDIEYKREGSRWILRIYLDKEGGVNLEDCSRVSRQIEAVLDVEDVIKHSFVLEVSSPGLTRPLKKIEDYHRFKDRLVKIKIPKGTFRGFIRAVDGAEIIIEEKKGRCLRIPFRDIVKANLEFEG